MYGTIARMRVRPDSGSLDDWLRRQSERRMAGHVATYVYRTDADPDELYVSVVFENRAAYEANARSPEQDASFRELRQQLAADPEWHDGEVVYQMAMAGRA